MSQYIAGTKPGHYFQIKWTVMGKQYMICPGCPVKLVCDKIDYFPMSACPDDFFPLKEEQIFQEKKFSLLKN